MGFDLNRHWLDPSPWAHPTLHGVKQLIIKMYNDPVSSKDALGSCWPMARSGNRKLYGEVLRQISLGLHEQN